MALLRTAQMQPRPWLGMVIAIGVTPISQDFSSTQPSLCFPIAKLPQRQQPRELGNQLEEYHLRQQMTLGPSAMAGLGEGNARMLETFKLVIISLTYSPQTISEFATVAVAP